MYIIFKRPEGVEGAEAGAGEESSAQNEGRGYGGNSGRGSCCSERRTGGVRVQRGWRYPELHSEYFP